jgi:WD40 repeat protein
VLLPGGASALVASSRTLEIRDLSTGAIISTVQSRGTFGDYYPRDHAVTPSARVLATVGERETDGNHLMLWDLSTGLQLRAIPSDGSDFRSLQFSPDSRQIAVVNPGKPRHTPATPLIGKGST